MGLLRPLRRCNVEFLDDRKSNDHNHVMLEYECATFIMVPLWPSFLVLSIIEFGSQYHP